MKWEGEVRDGSGAVVGTASGKVHLPYVAEENHGDDPELKILLDKEGSLENKLKQVLLPAFSTMHGAMDAGCVPVWSQGLGGVSSAVCWKREPRYDDGCICSVGCHQ